MSQPAYPSEIAMQPLTAPPNASIAVPGSKSITNRALILAALAEGRSVLRVALASDDTRVMIDALRKLGVAVEEQNRGETLIVTGNGGRLTTGDVELFVNNSGTSTRFLTALCALGSGCYRLDGVKRMRERPQGDLLRALQSLGVEVRSENENDCPPLFVRGHGGLPGGKVVMRAEASSQFVTALLMVAPYALNDITIEIEGALRPLYIEITRRMMRQWGVESDLDANGNFHVRAGQRYKPQAEYYIEPDASSASYFFAAAALTGGQVTIPGLASSALQGDVRFATEVLTQMDCMVSESASGLSVIGPPPGQLRGLDVDMSAISDTSLTLAAIAPFANSPTTVRNIAHSRLQECDRVHAVCTELSRLGVDVEEHPDGFTIQPATTFKPATIETYHDHRIAMSFALIGLRAPGVTIADPGCVAKTFPDYWQRLERLRSAP